MEHWITDRPPSEADADRFNAVELPDGDLTHWSMAAPPWRHTPSWRQPEKRQPRRITQLCGSTEGVFALCDDGTVWQLIGGVWAPEPAIPQRQLVEAEG